MEVVIAAGLMGILFAAVATTYSTSMGVLRGQRETIAANLLLQGRIDQIRAAGWSQVSEPETLRQNILGVASPQGPMLSAVHETVTVTAYPPTSPAQTPLLVERTTDGTTTIVSQPAAGFSLRKVLAVRVDVHVDWKSAQNSRTRTRETATVISLGGLLK